MSEGAHTLYLRARDQFGNASTMYQVPFVLKSDASLTVNLAAGSDTAPVGDLKTSLSIVTLEGQADPSALIELVGTSQTTTADAQGAYSLTDLNLTPGNNLFTVKTTDVAGNTRTVPITIIYEPVTGSVCFDDLLTGWIVEEFGGTTAGKGRVTASNGSATIREGDSFLVTLSHDFVVPLQDSATLTVEYSLPQFDATATAQLRDAFEIAFVDSRGQSLVLPIAQERDAFLNLTEGLNPAIAPGVTTATGEVTVNLAGLVPGSTGRLVLRLVNNDGDTQSNVTISCVKVNTVIGLSPTSATIQEEVRQTNAQTIDFTKLVNVSTSIVPEYGRTSFQQQGLQLYSSLSLRHAGSTPLRGPMLVVLDRVSDASIIPQDADGYLPDGRAYFNISSTLTDNRLNPGATTGPRTIHFHNPLRKPFSYSVQVYSLANEVPVFETQPSTLVPPGRTWSYAAQARDANGDTVSYRLLSFPGGMTVDSVTGNVTWPIPANFTGNVSVILQASDEWGGASEQAFTLSVGTVPNRPPVITSVPVVDAYVDEPYSYPVKAFDADFDVLNFTLVQGVGNASIDSATGLLSFMPTPETLGDHTIIVRVSDGQGGTVDQAYTLNIRNNRTNHAPLFVTDPVLRIVAGQLYQYDANAIDADNDTITYRLTSNIVGMSVDSSTGLFQWNTDSYSPGNYPVTIEADDGRGGVTGQHFTLAIVAGPAAIIRGNVFNDIGGDGPNSSGTVTHQLSVNSHDAIFLAGRSDVNIPPIGTNDPNFPLLRTGGSGANFSVENKPQQVSVNPGQVLTFKASGIVNGVDALNFNVEPDGDRGGFSTTINSTPAIGGISGYRGYIGALVGVFLGDENPAGGTAPATLNFDDNAGGNSKFKTLAPALGQVFYIGDGYTNKQTSLGLPSSGVPQRFTAPTGATRLFIGLPDGGPRFASSKTPGNYDDNIGSFDVTVNIHPASTIFYDDTEFDNANWTSAVTLYEDGNPSLDGGDIGFFQNTGGGNPDAMREGFHYLRVGDVLVSGNLNLNAVYNPSTQGAIQSLNVSIDFKQISVFFQGPDSTGAILYLEQDGVRYYGVKAYLGFGAGQGGVDVWLNKTGTLTANDFDTNPLAAVDPPSATGIKPNFTST
ncbi:MAG TPA: putative Ig domain-containing protein, partial [Gemmatales bacterium]|nr:putative Ig domain-containing protein [Gemmatales bacterium]